MWMNSEIVLEHVQAVSLPWGFWNCYTFAGAPVKRNAAKHDSVPSLDRWAVIRVLSGGPLDTAS